MVDLDFRQVEAEPGFGQTWLARAGGTQWKICCRDLSQDGEGRTCLILEKGPFDSRFYARLPSQMTLKDAKAMANQHHRADPASGQGG